MVSEIGGCINGGEKFSKYVITWDMRNWGGGWSNAKFCDGEKLVNSKLKTDNMMPTLNLTREPNKGIVNGNLNDHNYRYLPYRSKVIHKQCLHSVV